MTRGKYGRKSKKPELEYHYSCTEGMANKKPLASELTDQDKELTESRGVREMSLRNEEAQAAQSMANLETILQELQDLCHENSDTVEIIENIRAANNRIDDAERRIVEVEEQLQRIEDATLELLELQKQFETGL